MTNQSSDFDKIKSLIDQEGTDAALGFLAKQFSQQQEFHKLFEVLKMQARQECGLPLLYDENLDSLAPDTQKDFEEKLLQACEKVGELFFKAGDPTNGWMYLQPVADSDRARELLMQIPITPDNVDEVVQIALAESVAPSYGYDLMLKHFGTCNSITTYDSQVAVLSKPVKQETAELLIAHLYHEICENVRNHIQEQEQAAPKQSTLVELIADRDWLFSGGGHHVDTTHLASVVRIARNARDPAAIAKAIELCEYGMQLDEQFHFEGDEPFENVYPDHHQFFRGLNGDDPEQTEAWFLKKIAAMPPGMLKSITVETLIDFLANVGRPERAIEVSLRERDDEHQNMGIAPDLFALAQSEADFVKIKQHFEKDQDLLSFSIAQILANSSSTN